VGIFVFRGLIEDVRIFETKAKASGWLSGLAKEYGGDNCAESLIWDSVRNKPIYLGFVH